MFKWTNLLLICVLVLSYSSAINAAKNKKYGIGKAASVEEIAGWDKDVRPDGTGLPEGSGSVMDGEVLYEAQCASCHGDFGQGEGAWPVIAGGFDTLTDERPVKTVGSYWPYLSTLWEYIHNAMPFLNPQSLKPDEVYALTAYVLYLNDLVDDDFVLSKENFTTIKLPNEANFFDDPRPDVKNTHCMKNCRDPKKIKELLTAAELGVTPETPASAANNEVKTDDTKAKNNTVSNELGKKTYKNSCAVCHASGVAGAPVVGDKTQWQKRLEQGIETLYKHAIEGFQGSSGFMPAKGGFTALSDDDVKSSVDYMLENSR